MHYTCWTSHLCLHHSLACTCRHHQTIQLHVCIRTIFHETCTYVCIHHVHQAVHYSCIYTILQWTWSLDCFRQIFISRWVRTIMIWTEEYAKSTGKCLHRGGAGGAGVGAKPLRHMCNIGGGGLQSPSPSPNSTHSATLASVCLHYLAVLPSHVRTWIQHFY